MWQSKQIGSLRTNCTYLSDWYIIDVVNGFIFNDFKSINENFILLLHVVNEKRKREYSTNMKELREGRHRGNFNEQSTLFFLVTLDHQSTRSRTINSSNLLYCVTRFSFHLSNLRRSQLCDSIKKVRHNSVRWALLCLLSWCQRNDQCVACSGLISTTLLKQHRLNIRDRRQRYELVFSLSSN